MIAKSGGAELSDHNKTMGFFANGHMTSQSSFHTHHVTETIVKATVTGKPSFQASYIERYRHLQETPESCQGLKKGNYWLTYL